MQTRGNEVVTTRNPTLWLQPPSYSISNSNHFLCKSFGTQTSRYCSREVGKKVSSGKGELEETEAVQRNTKDGFQRKAGSCVNKQRWGETSPDNTGSSLRMHRPQLCLHKYIRGIKNVITILHHPWCSFEPL